MIELPDLPAPNGVSPTIIDYGIIQRPPTGGAVLNVGRPGSRFRIQLKFPPMDGDDARKFIARLVKAKRVGGIRAKFPILDVDQGLAGSPVVNGAGQAGTILAVRGVTPHYLCKEGFWLNAFDTMGQPYLHTASAPSVADASGLIILNIEPPLRFPFADGAKVELEKPVIEGFIDGGEWSWDIDLARHYGIAVTIEEAG